MVIDFKLLCEEVLLENVLNPILARISSDATNAKRDYDKHLKDPNQDKKFLFNAFKSEINDLRTQLKRELTKFGQIDISTPQKFDAWLIDRADLFPGLKYILYSYIKESKQLL